MAKKLWGGRFTSPINEDFESFSRSIHYDVRLAEYDVLHSIVHVKALYYEKLLTKDEKQSLNHALSSLLTEIRGGTFRADPDEEDIHSAVQNTLEKSVGPLALKLHTLRSRNDQIAFDVKFYCLTRAAALSVLLDDLCVSFEDLGKQYANVPFVGYTHTQRAQIIRFRDYCGAYAEMFRRDRTRLLDFPRHLSLQIGAGALTGSSLSAESYKKAVAELAEEGMLLQVRELRNAQDHVSDRDHVIELLSVLNIIQMHIGRFSADMILYSTAEFDYVDLPEAFCTGSSLMPHKKNADLMELLRGYSGRISGNLTELLVMMKGLPLTYNRDMQLDKEPLFESLDIVFEELRLLIKFVPGITLKSEKIRQALQDEHFYGVEIAEFLVHQGLAFKDAHDIVGRLIRYAGDAKIPIRDIAPRKLAEFHASLNPQSLKKIMTPEYALKQRRSVSEAPEGKD
ncbi:MAG: argininosuccinate lyase [Candidatus Marinimicrobia bacterium]|nr:argininosuccinate lyase [Candidatus Neomarinimicrobiota bacterium]MDD4960828.1 argininosuccinate lyase [Candidatus Neomarinimicrobiota bacterium]